MTGNLGELWSEYQVLNRLWETDHPDTSSTTKRQTELAEQIAAIEARDLGEVAIQAKVLAAGASWLALVLVLDLGIDGIIIASLVAIAVACGLGSLVPPEAQHVAEAIMRAMREPTTTTPPERSRKV